MNRLTILICTIPSRQASYGRLITELWGQMLIYAPNIGIIQNSSTELTIGEKRNWLLERAESEYVCFIDDDDMICENYLDLLMKAADTGCDCASLKGEYSVDGEFDGIFEHSVKYNKWETVEGEVKYLRYPNHLNMIRTEIANKFKFPEINHGEDKNWSDQLHKSGLLKKEFYISEVIYYYQYVSKKAHVLAKR